MKHSQFVGLSSRTGNWDLYLGKNPGPGVNREKEIQRLYDRAVERAPLMTQTFECAKKKVYELRALYGRNLHPAS